MNIIKPCAHNGKHYNSLAALIRDQAGSLPQDMAARRINSLVKQGIDLSLAIKLAIDKNSDTINSQITHLICEHCAKKRAASDYEKRKNSITGLVKRCNICKQTQSVPSNIRPALFKLHRPWVAILGSKPLGNTRPFYNISLTPRAAE